MRICARHAARGDPNLRAAAELAPNGRPPAPRPKSRAAPELARSGVVAERGASARELRICPQNADLRAPGAARGELERATEMRQIRVVRQRHPRASTPRAWHAMPRAATRNRGQIRQRRSGDLRPRPPDGANAAFAHSAGAPVGRLTPRTPRGGPDIATGERCPAPPGTELRGAQPAFAGRVGTVTGSPCRSRSRRAVRQHPCPCRTRPGCSSRRRSSAARRRPRGPPPWAAPGCCGTG